MWHDVRMMNTITNILLSVCVVAVLASGLWWVSQRPMFMLKTIEVKGAVSPHLRHASAPAIKNTVLPHLKGNFFTVDLDALRKTFETVPWVRTAMVRREWPNRLLVSVEEYEALGTWGQDGQLLSTKGDVFTANLAEAEADGTLLRFSGPKGSGRNVVSAFQKMTDRLEKISLSPVALFLSKRFAWSAILNNGTKLNLGKEKENRTVDTLVKRAVQVYAQLRQQGVTEIKQMDLRYPNGLALIANTSDLD